MSDSLELTSNRDLNDLIQSFIVSVSKLPFERLLERPGFAAAGYLTTNAIEFDSLVYTCDDLLPIKSSFNDLSLSMELKSFVSKELLVLLSYLEEEVDSTTTPLTLHGKENEPLSSAYWSFGYFGNNDSPLEDPPDRTTLAYMGRK